MSIHEDATLEFPLDDSFFPQVVLNADDVKRFKRLGKERLSTLLRMDEDANEGVYAWKEVKTRYAPNVTVQAAEFPVFRPTTKAKFMSTLLQSSIVLRETHADEILSVLAPTKTSTTRKTLAYLHRENFVDAQMLLKFPTSVQRSEFSYRALKWCAFRVGPHRKLVDFALLEYTGHRKPTSSSSVVAFCLQESVERERELPSLEEVGVVRGNMTHSGILIAKTHQPNAFRVTAYSQIDGDMDATQRHLMLELHQERMGAILSRLEGLVDRQRINSLKILEPWQFPPSERKACAVCTKKFFLRHKHNCETCGEVVCSSCGPMRDIEKSNGSTKEVRICQACMMRAARHVAATLAATSERSAETSSVASSESMNRPNGRYDTMEDVKPKKHHDHPHRPHAPPRPHGGAHPRANGPQLGPPHERAKALQEILRRTRQLHSSISDRLSNGDYYETLKGGDDDPFAELDAQVRGLRVRSDQAEPSSARQSGLRDSDYRQQDFSDDYMDSVAAKTLRVATATRRAAANVLSTYSASSSEFGEREVDSDGEDVSEILASIGGGSGSRSRSHASSRSSDTASYDRLQRRIPGRQPTSARRHLEMRILDLDRELSRAQRELSILDIDDDDVSVRYPSISYKAPSSARLSIPRASTSTASSGRASLTVDPAMVRELYSVMNSDEVTGPVLPRRRASITSGSSGRSSLSDSIEPFERVPSMPRARAPAPPRPLTATTVYIDSDGQSMVSSPHSTASHQSRQYLAESA
ncbi:hypothetical protein Poli38472_004362 [Pythium oligandrum]|uniref:FYVE-type domain-containing protein n=1 Tax=Pythium oligandrum TaxID=41045 RepID=A0A8K1FI14_PYTOL|nr:hypothetical protein Poli38472_004362 [Pythium oligandrum]|eukprot:TMW59293.1 hypothetical protein Poli38472_004362 [Pythium oligandrum]